MTLNTKQLSECFYKAITEHVPLQDKITQYITLQETNKPHTASRIKRRNKNLSSKTISHNNSNPNINCILTMNSNNNNTMSKCMNTTDLLKEKYLLRKHCEILKNRIGTLMLQEKEVKSKINYKRAKETSIEKIKQDKEKSKQMIEKLKKDNAKKVLDQKEKVNKARKTENNNLQRSKKNNYESKKYLYQSFINNKNKAISEQLVAGNYNNQFDISPSLFVRKHHTNYHSAERENKDKEILEKELLDLRKAEQMFKLRLEEAKEKFKQEISTYNTQCKKQNASIGKAITNTNTSLNIQQKHRRVKSVERRNCRNCDSNNVTMFKSQSTLDNASKL
jgi:hypothetical protein